MVLKYLAFPPDTISSRQLILIIPRFHICKFTYKLKFICNPKVNTGGASMVIHGLAQSSENLSHSMHTLPDEVETDDALPCCFNTNTVSNFLLAIYLVLCFCISVFFLGGFAT